MSMEYEKAYAKAQEMSAHELARVIAIMQRSGFVSEAEMHSVVLEGAKKIDCAELDNYSDMLREDYQVVPFAQAYYEHARERGGLERLIDHERQNKQLADHAR